MFMKGLSMAFSTNHWKFVTPCCKSRTANEKQQAMMNMLSIVKEGPEIVKIGQPVRQHD